LAGHRLANWNTLAYTVGGVFFALRRDPFRPIDPNNRDFRSSVPKK
jgi:hypothetical protein